MQVKIDDGGRAAAGFRGETGDCVARAIAIAAELPYQEVYTYLARGNAEQRPRRGKARGRRSARNGVSVRRQWFKDYMQALGFTWVPTMRIGEGCQVHLREDELPGGRLVVMVSKHLTAVIDGVIHDTHDPSRGGRRCVYGFWRLPHRCHGPTEPAWKLYQRLILAGT